MINELCLPQFSSFRKLLLILGSGKSSDEEGSHVNGRLVNLT